MVATNQWWHLEHWKCSRQQETKGLSFTMQPEQKAGYSGLPMPRGSLASCPGPPGPPEPTKSGGSWRQSLCSQGSCHQLWAMSFFSTGDSSPLWPLHQSGCSALFPSYHTFLSNIVPTRVLHTGPHYESICFCFLVGFPSGFSCVLASPSSSYWIKVFISGWSPFSLGWVSRVGC